MYSAFSQRQLEFNTDLSFVSTKGALSTALTQDFQSHPTNPHIAMGATSVSDGIIKSLSVV